MDGGISPSNLKICQEAGADTFVMGSAIFNTGNLNKSYIYQEVIRECREVLKKI
jgi:pentose-5-phosphate-3-epimerase